MSALVIKKTSVLTTIFIFAYYFSGFQVFAAVLVTSFFYQVSTRRLKKTDIYSAGILPLVAIFLIALLSSVTLSPFAFSLWNISKDSYFFFAPVLMLMSGLTFVRSTVDVTEVIYTAIIVLTITTIVVFADFLFSGGIADISLQSRYSYGLDSTASLLAVILIISSRSSLVSLMRSRSLFILLFLNLLLIVVSLSRVNIAIMLVSLVFVYSISKLVRGGVIVAVMLLTLAPLQQISPRSSSADESVNASFIDKVQGSLDEFLIAEYSDFAEINKYWRGHEAYLGIRQVENVGGAAYLFGVGFGSFAMGPFVGKLEVIPFFHNGFVTIYLKAGFLGLGIFALFVIRLYRTGLSALYRSRLVSDPRAVQASLLIVLLTNSILLKTLVTHGIYYSKPALELFLVGVAIVYLRQTRRGQMGLRLRDPIVSTVVGRKGQMG